jgi:cation diffusion facilitator CzcD-associated flavoprotein CzcO
MVTAATGVLHHPNLPDIPGLADFQGACFHSARWDDTALLDGRRIGVIGSGSTGVTGAAAGRPARVVQDGSLRLAPLDPPPSAGQLSRQLSII